MSGVGAFLQLEQLPRHELVEPRHGDREAGERSERGERLLLALEHALQIAVGVLAERGAHSGGFADSFHRLLGPDGGGECLRVRQLGEEQMESRGIRDREVVAQPRPVPAHRAVAVNAGAGERFPRGIAEDDGRTAGTAADVAGEVAGCGQHPQGVDR